MCVLGTFLLTQDSRIFLNLSIAFSSIYILDLYHVVRHVFKIIECRVLVK